MGKKEKIQLGIIGGIVIATGVFLWFRDGKSHKTEGVWITRPESGTKQQAIVMELEEESEEWEFSVNPREKTSEEIEAAFAETVRILEERLEVREDGTILVIENISLPQCVTETGVDIRWQSSNTEVVTKDGQVHREGLLGPCKVSLQARMYFVGEDREHWFAAEVLPYEEGSKEALLHGAKEALEQLEQETAGEEGFYLPESIGRVTVALPEQSGALPGLLVASALFLPFGVFISKRQEKEKEKKKWEKAMLEGYPQLVTKLTLYIGAGMSLRGAWERLATEYRTVAEQTGKRSAVDDEIFILAGELKNGTPEAKAYENFGRRIGLKPYTRCAALLVSQSPKGSGNLRRGLEAESALAWELQKERAAKKGEEAQTKLLFPMMGMLFLIMAVVMIPAFFTM